MQDDSITMEKDSKPSHSSYYHHPSNNTNHDSFMKPRGGATPTKERNIIDEPFKPSESNHHSHYNNKFPTNNNNNNNNNNRFFDRPPHLDSLKSSREYAAAVAYEANKRRELETFDALHHRHNHITASSNHSSRDHSPHRYESPLYPPLPPGQQGRNGLGSRLTAEPPHLRVETTADGSAPSPLGSTLSPNRKRPRPSPIIIPAAVNNRSIPTTISPSRHLSFPKGIYTPPAMLSPRSIFFNPPFAPRHGYQTTPVTTSGRMQLGKRRTCKSFCSFFNTNDYYFENRVATSSFLLYKELHTVL